MFRRSQTVPTLLGGLSLQNFVHVFLQFINILTFLLLSLKLLRNPITNLMHLIFWYFALYFGVDLLQRRELRWRGYEYATTYIYIYIHIHTNIYWSCLQVFDDSWMWPNAAVFILKFFWWIRPLWISPCLSRSP